MVLQPLEKEIKNGAASMVDSKFKREVQGVIDYVKARRIILEVSYYKSDN